MRVAAQNSTPPSRPEVTRDAAPRDAQADEGDEHVERVGTSLTNVLLSVTDKNRRFVTTLAPGDVRVLEDGVPQEVFTFQRETDLPLSIALLVDASASQEGVLKDEQEAALAFVNSILRPQKDRGAVLSFTGVTRLEKPLTDDVAQLKEAVESVRVPFPYGSPECQDDETPEEVRMRCLTGVWDAIHVTVREVLAGAPEHARRAVILLSDGDDTSSRTRRHQAIEYAVRHNVAVYAVGIRDPKFKAGKLDRNALRAVAEQTGGRAFFPRDRRELEAAFTQIEQELRSQYLVAYSPANKSQDGSYRKIEIELINPKLRKEKLRLLYRQGYYASDGSSQKGETMPPEPL